MILAETVEVSKLGISVDIGRSLDWSEDGGFSVILKNSFRFFNITISATHSKYQQNFK